MNATASLGRAVRLDRDEASRGDFDDTVFGIPLPTSSAGAVREPIVDLEQTTHDIYSTRDFPPTPSYRCASTATPSTRYTDSPYSRIRTPSSASSYSPAIVTTSENLDRMPSTTSKRSRPSVDSNGQVSSKEHATRPSLPLVRESSTSSSNSTIQPETRTSTRILDIPDSAARTKIAHPRKQAPQTVPDSASSVPSRQSRQVPPELAHLNVDVPPRSVSTAKPLPPARPSRDGISNIGETNTAYVVQSDLPKLYTSNHRRTPSQDTPVSVSSPSFRSRFGFSSRASSRNASPRVDSAISPPASARHFHRGPTPENPTKEGAKLQRKDSPAVAAAPSPAKSSRFSLFSRKTKADASKTAEKPQRQPVKGPAAGTGHEGYARFGFHARNGSATSSGGVRSPSTDSGSSSAPRVLTKKRSSARAAAEPELDDFLRQRQHPIVLRGSGSTISNTASNSDLPGTSSHPASSKTSSLDSHRQSQSLASAPTGPGLGSRIERPAVPFRTFSESSEDEASMRPPSLAARRSLIRMFSEGSRSPARLPARINTNIPPRPPELDSYDAESSAWPQTDSTLPFTEETRLDGPRLGSLSSSEELIAKTGRQQNFLQRANASPRSIIEVTANDSCSVPRHLSHQRPTLGVTHHAILGPVQPVGLEEVERIAHENETLMEGATATGVAPQKGATKEARRHSLLPSPLRPDHDRAGKRDLRPTPLRAAVERQPFTESPELLPDHPAYAPPPPGLLRTLGPPLESHYEPLPGLPVQVMDSSSTNVSTPETAQGAFCTPDESPRQPRLSPIGRIPQVISRRDRDRKLSDNSFSRPFARTQPRPAVKPPGSIYNQIRRMASPVDSSSQPVSSTSTRSGSTSVDYKGSSYTSAPTISTTRTSMDVHTHSEFFRFPSRKDSELSHQSYSSSGGEPSWLASWQAQLPQQEDIWNEYNDFLDEVMPLKTQMRTPTTGSSLGAPFQYSGVLAGGPDTHETPAYATQMPSSKLPLAATSGNAATVLSVPQQISRFLQPSMSPLVSPDTISALVGDYGNRSTSTLFTNDRLSVSSQHRASLQQYPASGNPGAHDSTTSSRHSRGTPVHSRSSSLPEANARHSQSSLTPKARTIRDKQLLDIAEVPTDQSTTSLRFGALLTSKWLSFGRILFSPAHNEVQLAEEPKVLVVDGLSSDWSHYVAMSYPSAEVYNLTSRMPGSPSVSWPDDNENLKPPHNLRQYRTADPSTPFPWPKGFFNAVVFRFPTATTEDSYQYCISECKRVLRPGGYLEVAVLDLDLMNMGAKARKAVRGLKTRMQQRDPEVCLRNLSDILVRFIGRRGFESVQRCIVGVPAAGRIPRSQDMSSVSSDSSGRPVWQHEAPSSKSQEFSFADLLDDSPTKQFGAGKTTDETITKMVAKVGRWWYTTCYEKALLPGDQSIWNDATLLRECERQGTSFRLLICHAQKPTQTRRRTVSV